MKYILTEQEYEDLKNQASLDKKRLEKTLQDLCTKVCDHMPVKWDWGDEKIFKPWGCILSGEKSGENEGWYCDQCPVQDQCPYPHKRYSQ